MSNEYETIKTELKKLGYSLEEKYFYELEVERKKAQNQPKTKTNEIQALKDKSTSRIKPSKMWYP